LIAIRRARPADAPGIGAVHVASWRSAYAGVLPDDFLANLSVARQTAYYERAIRIGLGVHVAVLNPLEIPGRPAALQPAAPNGSRVVGFSTARRNRGAAVAEGEVETLYVQDDWRDNGLGRMLLRASAQHLAAMGCKSAFAWVLRDNPSIFFYERLGGKRVAMSTTRVGGSDIPQTAYAWDPIERLINETV
jgi:ribosomal protein S18 acetylase RimI-like enzyme